MKEGKERNKKKRWPSWDLGKTTNNSAWKTHSVYAERSKRGQTLKPPVS